MDLHYRRLLLIACSQRKKQDQNPLPAIERYDGGSYRVIHKGQREGVFPGSVDIAILSAKYGLITATTPIYNYEQRMDRVQADSLKLKNMQTIKEIATSTRYDEVYVDLGQIYLLAIDELTPIFTKATIIYAQGRVGERLAKLKQWLAEMRQREIAMM